MPKINPIKISTRGVGSLYFSHSYPTDVLSTGIFQTYIPDDQVEVIRGLAERDDLKGVDCTTNRADKPVLQATELAPIQRLLEAYGRTRVETVDHTDLILFYKLNSNTRYVVGADGDVHPDGVGVEGYEWMNPGQGSHMSRLDYSVGVTARIVARKTSRFSGGFHIKHLNPELPRESFGGRLNAFTHVDYPNEDFWSAAVEGERRYPLRDDHPDGYKVYSNTGWQFMPYTEENARFFYEMMLNICRLSERISQYLGADPKALSENIASAKALPKL
ncbi:hypothetical protein [Rhizobium sp. MHM7A]|uniref:hypothetical protein n=1 Tax=Rhizobium sp. MHM7A TaxID=2583233 RepID=UPI00110751C7|nr:hypothetical protein [Rhizobium sp. MHM7A]TLX15988.1 hypothetical protein FFR93_01335 [Rhizobium sp. MHM7A]